MCINVYVADDYGWMKIYSPQTYIYSMLYLNNLDFFMYIEI